MHTLLPLLRSHFAAREEALVSFCRHEMQVEGWLKGELLTLLDALAAKGTVSAVEREIALGRKKIDVGLHANGKRQLIELKHLHIGKQKGTRYGAAFYFSDAECIATDVRKLHASTGAERWLLALCTANPGEGEWQEAMTTFNRRFAPFWLEAHSSPSDYPPTFFLGLVSVR